MTASLLAKSNGTQGALQVNGVDSLVFDNAGLVSGIKPASITPAMLNGAQTGSAPIYGARAWCVFNGTTTGTNAPTNGGNIASITKVGTGSYTCLFVTSMPNANYAVVFCSSNNGSFRATHEYLSKTTTGFSFTTTQAGTNAAADFPDVSFIVIG